VDEQLLKIETRQKEIMAKYDMPHSPLRAPMDFPPPPTFYNTWEEMGGPSMMFDAPHDLWPLYVSAIKLFVGFGVDDHLIRKLMRFIEMTCR
jgi:hypothetical protein